MHRTTLVLRTLLVIALISFSFGIPNSASAFVGTVTAAGSVIGSNTNDQVGSGGVIALSNGNVLIISPNWNGGRGAVTCVTPAQYQAGNVVVSAANSIVGGAATHNVGSGGVTVLSNGNYVVRSPNWDNGATTNVGAATWGNGNCSTVGTVSAANSLIGSRANDQVSSGGVTALTNGNYAVSSPNWDNGGAIQNAGAATWGSGTTGITGTISSANSLIGSREDDRVSSDGIIALTNGNYVVSSSDWDNGAANENAGAATWGNGTSGTTGTVSSSNSLVGTQEDDHVARDGAVALTNGNYVVASRDWDNGGTENVGAATWGNGTSGTTGAVTTTNSLVGSRQDDHVSQNGITALTNGNYVVASPEWDNGAAVQNAGAATWGSGTTGITGTITAANSLIGSRNNDRVSGGDVTALTNGNYVVASPEWDNGAAITNAGAATWGNGSTGRTGTISAANSLIGSRNNDRVSGGDVTALTNGNYVVASPDWDNGAAITDAGAATWGNGSTGILGAVGTGNSLVGGANNNQVSSGGVTALTNGNYVVASPNWDNGATANVGAATWGNGTSGITATVGTGNSLVGSRANDQVSSSGVTTLTNGNYVVRSPNWDNGAAITDAGAATWGNGTGGTTGAVSSGNSFVGSTNNDQVGNSSITTLIDGNYVVRVPNWDNGATANVGAATWGDGFTGSTGAIAVANSLIGTTNNDQVSSTAVLALNSGYYAVASQNWDNGGTANVGAVTFGIPPEPTLKVELSSATASGLEGNSGTAAVTSVTLLVKGGISFSPRTVELALTNGTATLASNDYSQTSILITIPAGNYIGVTAVNIPVSALGIVGDTVLESNETLTLTLQNPGTKLTIADANSDSTTQSSTVYTITNDDTAALTIADVSQNEDNSGTTTQTFTVTLNNAVQGGFTVNYATTNSSAIAGSDYTASTGTLTFVGTTGETQTFTVPITGELMLEPNETFGVSLNTISNTAVVITDTATGTIVNDDTAALTIADVSQNEGNSGTTTQTFTVTLDNPVQGGFTVNYATNDSSAIAGSDYTASTGTLTFVGTAGETQTFTVPITGELMLEPDETFGVSLNTISNTAVVITDTATGTIVNDDTAALTIADVSQNEGNSGTTTQTFTVTLDNPVQGGFTVNYATNDSSAIASSDYATSTGTLTFVGNAGETQTFTVDITGELMLEPDETFGVSLNTISNTAVDITDTATGTIVNDDTAALTIADVSQNEGNSGTTTQTFTVTLDNPVQGGFTVNYATNDSSAIAGSDYANSTGTLTFVGNAGETQTFTVDITGELMLEPDETFGVSLNTISNAAVVITDTATGTIVNDDTAALTIADVSQNEGNSGITTQTFTVTLDNPVQGGFTVNYATNDSSAVAGSDYATSTGTLTFIGTAGESYTFTVDITGELMLEPDETFGVGLNTISNTAVDITDTATGTIVNDDTAVLTIADVSQNEGNSGTTTQTFTVTLDNPFQGGFTVNYATNDSSAVAGSDYATSIGTLTFIGNAGETQTFTVTINGDITLEADETFGVSLNTSSNAVVDITNTAIGTIVNDDTAALTVADVSQNEGNSGTTTQTFTVTLDNPVQGGFTVNYATNDSSAVAGSDYVAGTGTLTFIGNAGESHTFTVTVNGDLMLEPNETFGVSLNTISNPAVIITDTAIGTIVNDDTAALTIADVSQNEGNSGTTTQTFTVTLDNPVQGGFTVNYVTTDNTAIAGSDYATSTGTLTFIGNAGESHTFTVTINGDLMLEPDETFGVSLNTVSNAAVAITDTATGTIVNDDSAAVTIANVSQAEGDSGTATQTFTATLNNPVQSGFTVNYATANNSAQAGSDYVAGTGPLTFAGTAGESHTFTVTINGDTIVETNETFGVSLNSVSNPAVDITDTAIGTINNDDSATITLNSVTQTEGNSGTTTMTFTATLSNVVQGGVTVNYATANGSAQAGSDYVNSTGTLTFAGTAGETRTFTVTINGDKMVEADETFTVGLNTVSNPAIDITSTGTGTITNDDSATVTIADVSQNEGNSGTTTQTFIATLDNPVQGGFTVNYATNDSSAIAGSDYASSTGTLTFAGNAGESQTFTVTINGDLMLEPDETFGVSLNTVSKASIDITDTATGTIVNDDTAALTVADVSQNEGNSGTTTQTYIVTLDSPVQGGFTVNYATADSSAITGSDYVASTGTLTFVGNAGETQTFTVTINGDLILEPDETFGVSLNTVSNTGVNISDTATGTIVNDDTAGVNLDSVSQTEGDSGTSTQTFTATLNSQVQGGFTVNYVTANASAQAGSDYVNSTGTLTFAGNVGETQTFTVTISGDTVVEADETFTVGLNTASNPAVNITSTGTGTITNDDSATVTLNSVGQNEGNSGTTTQTFIATLNNPVQGGFTVNYATANGSAQAGSDYANSTGTLTFAGGAGETQTFTVTINGDTAVEADETFTVGLNTVSNASINITSTGIGTINNDDSATIAVENVTQAEGDSGTSPMTFTVTLDNPVQGGFTVNYATTDGSAQLGSDFTNGTGTVTFVGNAGETQTFSVDITGDMILEPDESFTVGFNTVSNASIGIADIATGTITNDDVASVTIADVSQNEGNSGTTTQTFTATLNITVPGGFTVNYATADGSAQAGTDYVSSTGTLTFAGTAGETQTFTVTINGDAQVEPDETFTASLNSISNAAIDITDTATGTLVNDDTVGITVDYSPSSGLTTDENGATASFTVVLTSQPTAPVVINLVSTNTAEGTLSVGTLTFGTNSGAGGWDTPQTVTITGQDDLLADGDIPYSVQITVDPGTGDPAYAALDPNDINVTNNDNDTPGLVFTPTSGSVTEGGTITYAVRLTTQPTDTVIIDLSTISTETTITTTPVPVQLTFTPANWNVDQTVTLTVADNNAIDGTRTADIIQNVSSVNDTTYNALPDETFVLTIKDNDVPGLTIAPNPLTVGEGNSVSYTVVLNTQPIGDVVVTLSTASTETTITTTPLPVTLTFTPANWNAPQTVTLAVADNTIVDGTRIATIVHDISSPNDPIYNALPDEPLALTINDNDAPNATQEPTSDNGNGKLLELRGISVMTADGQTVAKPGDEAVWIYTVKNISGRTLTNIGLLVTYPDDDMGGLSATTSIGISGVFRKGSLLAEYSIPSMSANELFTVTIRTKLPNHAGRFVGTLTATVNGAPEPDKAVLILFAAGTLPSTGETSSWTVITKSGALPPLALLLFLIVVAAWLKRRKSADVAKR